MPHLPKKDAGLFQSVTVPLGSDDEIIITADHAEKYRVWRIVNEGPAVCHLIATAFDSTVNADAQQIRLYVGESYTWRLRADERRLAVHNPSATDSTTVAIMPVVKS